MNDQSSSNAEAEQRAPVQKNGLTASKIDLPPNFYLGIKLFNDREFFECHEVLEDVWRDQVEPERQLTQGIIQIAVALYHARRGNLVGAKKLLHRGIPRVEISLNLPVDIDVSRLLACAMEADAAIQAGLAPQAFDIKLKLI